jgi:hypothetical protein
LRLRRDNNISLHPNELGCDLGEARIASLRKAIQNRNAAIFDPTELAQALPQSELSLRPRPSGPPVG